MDGIHDLGGMFGFERVEAQADEAVFHEKWEGRVLVMLGAVLEAGVGNVDKFRHAIERMPVERYLKASYYERWLTAVETLLIEDGILSRDQIDERARRLREGTAAALKEGAPRPRLAASGAKRSVDRQPKFAAGQAVRTRKAPSAGHTRLPRYARGKEGRIGEVYPAFVLPDSHAHDSGEQPQHVYSVLFDGGELWGEAAEASTTIGLDLFESYLEPRDV